MRQLRGIDPWKLGLNVVGDVADEYLCKCPYHTDTHPSACFNPFLGVLFCFQCGRASSAKTLANLTGGSIVWGNLRKANKRASEFEWRPILNSGLAIDNWYLSTRGVDNQLVLKYGILQIPAGVAIPLKSKNGNIIGVIIRRENGNPRYLNYGDKPPIWPMEELNKVSRNAPIFLVEGIFGVLRAKAAGVNNVFATLGASIKTELSTVLSGYKPTILFDNDFAGYSGAGKLLQSIPMAKVIVPGTEADELSHEEWSAIGAGEVLTTRSISQLARLSEDKSKFYAAINGRKMGNKHGR